MDTERKPGTIIRLQPNKGYGFIRGSDGITRFFHARQAGITQEGLPLFDTLREGQAVSFIPTRDLANIEKGGGWRAERVIVEGSVEPVFLDD